MNVTQLAEQLNAGINPADIDGYDAARADDRIPDESRSFDTDAPPGGHMGLAGDPAEGTIPHLSDE